MHKTLVNFKERWLELWRANCILGTVKDNKQIYTGI